MHCPCHLATDCSSRPPSRTADSDYVKLTSELSRAQQAVDESFDTWRECRRTSNAEIKISSYSEYISCNDRRVRELKGEYQTPRFYNDGTENNERLNYTIAQIKDSTRKWQHKIVGLRQDLDVSEKAFADWQEAIRRVNELEKELAKGDRFIFPEEKK